MSATEHKIRLALLARCEAGQSVRAPRPGRCYSAVSAAANACSAHPELLETFTMGCQKKHRRVNPRFAECLREMQVLHALESAENEGWPASLMRSVANNASGAMHAASREFRRTAASA
jgi:hypothetical protein